MLISMRNPMVNYSWIIVLRGLIVLLSGVVAFIWPDIALRTLIVMFGLFMVL